MQKKKLSLYKVRIGRLTNNNGKYLTTSFMLTSLCIKSLTSFFMFADNFQATRKTCGLPLLAPMGQDPHHSPAP